MKTAWRLGTIKEYFNKIVDVRGISSGIYITGLHDLRPKLEG